MNRAIAILGTAMVFAGVTAFAEDAKPQAAAPAPAAGGCAVAPVAPAKPAVPTAAEILGELRKMTPEQRQEAKTQMENAKQQFAMIKTMVASQSQDNPDAMKQLAMAEEGMNKTSEMFAALEEVDAAKTAGDAAKQAAANKALEAKADEYAKLMERMMAAHAAAKPMAVKKVAGAPGATIAKEQLAYGKNGEIPVRANYVSVTTDGSVYAACGGTVKMFGQDRKLVREWTVPATAVAADGKGGVYAIGAKKLAKLAVTDGKPVVEQSWDLDAKVKNITSMKLSGNTILVGESNPGRCIHKISAADGKYLGKVSCFISTCCGILDFDVDAKGNVVVANLGQHRVSVTPVDGDGKSVINWGTSGDEANKFCGCCNPVSVAVLPYGTIATSEKTITRIKIYSADGKTLLMNMPAKELGTKCEKLDIAVDAKSNIYVNDEEGGKIVILSPAAKAAAAPAPAEAPAAKE